MHSLYGLGATAGGGASVAELQAAAAAAALATTTDVSDYLSGSKDTTLTKIFVGGLPYHTSDKTLHEYFEQFGEIEEAVVITDRQTQKSRGYGFVTMKDRPAAERACKDPNPIIDGRKANVNLAYLGAKPRGNMQLAGMTSGGGIQQLPLQTQLQALFPQRLGMPQLFMPQQAFMNPLLGLGGAQSHQIMDYSQALAAAMAAQNGASAGGASAAAAHAAALNQNAAAAALFQHAGVPVSSAAGSLDPYAAAAAAYNPYAAFQGGFPLQSAQLAAASAAAAAAEHQRV
ncbi:hypothetical protein PFISCL1PPCAC_26228 [Pristionchus fissidentatus]|uniref:RRM domain-containing protein n=1 Tax=Pristionchus fissidentatus TaxID=1538716 RepID=A0AAV5WSC4_9BILA|nr:hypothetical protein PFISCL1PPCAC_26228 [Pristionchus fissidentatus]